MGATLASDNQNECIGYARECVRLAELTFEQQIRDILLDMAHEWTAVAMDEWAEPVRIMDEDVIVAAQDPAERPRMDNGESFQDPAINEPFHSEVSVQEDRYENGEWRIKYFDADGGCYVTIFAGPMAQQRRVNIMAPSQTERFCLFVSRSLRAPVQTDQLTPGQSRSCVPRR